MSEIIATLEYEGEQYTVHMDRGQRKDRTEEEDEHLDYYMWTDGNYSCDCNRSLFISYEYDGFLDDDDEDDIFPCGETIKLVSLMLDGKDLLAPTVNERLAAIGLFSYGGL